MTEACHSKTYEDHHDAARCDPLSEPIPSALGALGIGSKDVGLTAAPACASNVRSCAGAESIRDSPPYSLSTFAASCAWCNDACLLQELGIQAQHRHGPSTTRNELYPLPADSPEVLNLVRRYALV